MSAPPSDSERGYHTSIDNVVAELHRLGASGSVRLLPEQASTAQQAADGLGCEVGAIANSLVFTVHGFLTHTAETKAFDTNSSGADSGAVLILTSGAHRVDTIKVAAAIGVAAMSKATPEFVGAHTGQAIGGVAPLGHLVRLTTYIDRDLASFPVVWAAAGHSHAVFDTTYDELLAMTGAIAIDVD